MTRHAGRGALQTVPIGELRLRFGPFARIVGGWLLLMQAIRATPAGLAVGLFAGGALVVVLIVALIVAYWPFVLALVALYLLARGLVAGYRRKRADFDANDALGDGPTDFGEWMRWKGKDQ